MPVTDFDSYEWDEWRQELEARVLSSAFALANFMGSNSFTLGGVLNDVKVLITPKEKDEAIS